MASMAMTVDPSSARSGPLTVRDLERTPDDGRRYELIDGTLVVSPAPGRRHQKIVGELYRIFMDRCPDELDVIPAPFAVQPTDRTEVQPDVLVARFDEVTDRNLPTAPLLAVEILSPSTALIDLNTKKALYERMGVPSYWVIDPEGPVQLTVFELGERGAYEPVAEVIGDKAFEASAPFPVRIVPAELLGRLRDH